MFSHLRNKVFKLKSKVKLNYKDIIIDIGNNDETFLSFFDKKFTLIRIDPTTKKFSNYYKKIFLNILNFFLYEHIKDKLKNKKAKLIIIISMFYHLLNLVKFEEGIYKTLDKNGIWYL